VGKFYSDLKYYEDADFCLRARQAGFEIRCAPPARMWHKVSRSARKQKAATRYPQSWGRVTFYRRQALRLSWPLLIAYLLLKGVWTMGRDLTAGTGATGHGRELTAPLWAGLWDGLWGRPARWQRFL
jgi:hypothetical protein